MCINLNSIFDSEIKVYYGTQVLRQSINIKTMCPNYKLQTVENTKIAFIASLSRRVGQDRNCHKKNSKLLSKFEHFTSKLESQPLKPVHQLRDSFEKAYKITTLTKHILI